VVDKAAFEANPKLAAIKDKLCVDGSWTLRISPHHTVTLGHKVREEVMIPQEAMAFAWVYPSLPPSVLKAKKTTHTDASTSSPATKAADKTVKDTGNKRSKVGAKGAPAPKAEVGPNEDSNDSDDDGLDTADPDVSLAVNGGFAYFDSADNVIRLHAVMGFALDWRERKAHFACVPDSEPGVTDEAMLQFEPAMHLPAAALKSLKPALAPVTWRRLRECSNLDQLEMVWIHPSQELGKKKYSQGGGFAFALANGASGSNSRFPVLFELASC